MRVYLAGLQTGDLIAEWPGVQITEALERRLGDYRTGKIALPVAGGQAPATWAEDMQPWRTLVVVCDDDDNPVWWGTPNVKTTNTDPKPEWELVTLEKYADRRYMPTAYFEDVDQTGVIARQMFEVIGDDVQGIGLEYDTPASGVTRYREYADDEDARVLSRLQELAQLQDGFEWEIVVEWRDADHTGFRKIARTGHPYLGAVTDDPEYIFEVAQGVAGPVTSFDHGDQWGEGDAATHVMAVGDGQGEDKPYSAAVIDTDREANGWPRLEERISQSGVIEDDLLDQAAAGQAAKLFGGQESFEFEAQISAWPSPADIDLGDSVRVRIVTDQLQLDEVWRIVGYSIDRSAGTWKPVVAKPGDDQQEIDDGGEDA